MPAGPYVRCLKCGFIWLENSQDRARSRGGGDYTASEDRMRKNQKLADDYWQKLYPYLSQLKPGSLFVELGGGYGFFSALLRNRLSLTAILIEPGDTGRDYASEVLKLRTYRSVEEARTAGLSHADMIFSGHVWEHVSHAVNFVRESVPLLKDQGLWCALTPNADSWKLQYAGKCWCWLSSDHPQILSPRSARFALNKSQLKVIAIKETIPASVHYPGVLIGLFSWLKERFKKEKLSRGHFTLSSQTSDQPKRKVGRLPWVRYFFCCLQSVALLERFGFYQIDRRFGTDEFLAVGKRKGCPADPSASS